MFTSLEQKTNVVQNNSKFNKKRNRQVQSNINHEHSTSEEIEEPEHTMHNILKEKAVKRKLIESTKNIKHKYKELKADLMSENAFLEQTFKPITKPLQALLDENKNTDKYTTTPIDIKKPLLNILLKTHLNQLSLPISRNTICDTTYGVRLVGGLYMMGKNTVQFIDNDIVINDVTYKGTEGLYELLFKKKPEGFTKNDLETYSAILKQTLAHKKRYVQTAPINANKGFKYTTIIKTLFPPPHLLTIPTSRSSSSSSDASSPRFGIPTSVGNGLQWKNEILNHIDYVHWNDPNELVVRLQLLMASKMAGHTSHDNEIIAIEEELREAKIIE